MLKLIRLFLRGFFMLDLRFIRTNLDAVKEMLKNRHNDLDLSLFETIDKRRREILPALETLRHRRNTVSEEIAGMKKQRQDASGLIEKMKKVSAEIKEMEAVLSQVDEDLRPFLMVIPNMPHESVPVGAGSEDNPVVRNWGQIPEMDFEALPHWDIGERLGILDFAAASKLAGSRFALYRGAGALLERALISFMLDIHTREHGYTEVLPPFMVNSASLLGTGQLPKFKEDLFKIEGWDLFLIPTAEVPVTNIHREEVLAEESLPIHYVSYTPCFRSEAGSYGKDTRGLIRQHQFNKVELVKFCKPEHSYQELEELTGHAETILQRLDLPYRVVSLCTGDLGFASAKTYDLEVWLPGQGLYREISSCSNFEDFQARRAGIRFKRKGAGGTVRIPQALQSYMGGIEFIKPIPQ
jgi:seryl-tRNA synthetase